MSQLAGARLSGRLLVAAACAMLGGALVRPNTNGSEWTLQYEQIAASPGLAFASAALWAAAGFLLLGVAASLPSLVSSGRGRRWMLAAGWLIGMLSLYCFAARVIVIGILHGGAAAGLDPAPTLEAFSNGDASVFLAPIFVGGLILAPIILAIAIWRSGRGSWVPGITWFVGFIIYSIFEWSGILREAFGWIIMVGSLVWMGIELMRPVGGEMSANPGTQATPQ